MGDGVDKSRLGRNIPDVLYRGHLTEGGDEEKHGVAPKVSSSRLQEHGRSAGGSDGSHLQNADDPKLGFRSYGLNRVVARHLKEVLEATSEDRGGLDNDLANASELDSVNKTHGMSNKWVKKVQRKDC